MERLKTLFPIVLAVAAIALYVWWQSLQPGNDVDAPGTVPISWQTPDRANACAHTVGDTPRDRVATCLGRLGTSAISSGLKEELDSMAKDGKSLLAARIAMPGTTLALADHPELLTPLLGNDDAAAAKALADAGIRNLLVSRDLTGALDRDQLVLSRLAQHDFLEWFNLRWITPDLMVYTVRNSSERMPLSTGDQLLSGLRDRLSGLTPSPQRWHPESVRLLGSMRLQGETLAIRHAAAGTKDGIAEDRVVDQALDDLAAALRREWDRNVEVKGIGKLQDRLKDIRLEVHVVMERATVEPRSRYQIFDLWEMGVDGMMLKNKVGADDEKFTFLPGSEAITRALHTADDFLQYATKENWREKRPWEDPNTRLDLIRDQHFMERDPGGRTGAVRLLRALPEVPMEAVTDRNVQSMLVSGGEWWLTNQFDDGSFEYKYWPEQNRQSTEYNEVRHILGIRDLADVWRYRHDGRYLTGSAKAMNWLLKFLVQDTDPPAGPFKSANQEILLPHPPPGTILFRYPAASSGDLPNQKLGTVAVAVLGWVAYAEATGDHSQDELIRKMGKFIEAMTDANGHFRPYDVPANHPYATENNDIVPGEAGLALGKIAAYFGEKDWLAYYDKFVSYYQPWFDTRANRKVVGGRWPIDTYETQDRLDLVQFGPWSVMAAAQYYAQTKDERAAKFGLEVADWMIDNYQWTSERAPWPDYVGGYYKLPEELPAMQTFCYSEGTAAAYRLATLYAPERAERYAKATREAIRFLEVIQYDDVDSYFVARPEKVHGGVKYEMAQNKIRIDYVGHAMSTLSQYLDNRGRDPSVHLDIFDPAAPDTFGADHPSTPEEYAAQLRGEALPGPAGRGPTPEQGNPPSGLPPFAPPDRTEDEGD
jgi:hypothetical protein